MNFSCIYSIQCKDKEVKEFYIGSCKNYRKRKKDHKYNCNTLKQETTIYKYIRQNGGWDNWEMIVEVKTDDLCKEERLELEQYYMDLLKPCLNEVYAKGKNKEKRLLSFRNFNNKRKNCPHCNLEMNNSSISRHIKKQHT